MLVDDSNVDNTLAQKRENQALKCFQHGFDLFYAVSA